MCPACRCGAPLVVVGPVAPVVVVVVCDGDAYSPVCPALPAAHPTMPARLLLQVASGSPAACTAAAEKMLIPLTRQLHALVAGGSDSARNGGGSSSSAAVGGMGNRQHACLAMAVLHGVLGAVAAAATRQDWQASATQQLAPALADALRLLERQQQPLAAASGGDVADAEGGPAAGACAAYLSTPTAAAPWPDVQLHAWAVRLWGCLLAFPPHLPHLGPGDMEAAAGQLLAAAQAGGQGEEVPLGLVAEGLDGVGEQAAAGEQTAAAAATRGAEAAAAA